jgi:putative transposase
MARFARVVVPGLPHHVTARGNRREPIFFEDGDQDVYADMLAEPSARRTGAGRPSSIPAPAGAATCSTGASRGADERHLLAAVRYVNLNPGRAGLVARAQDWAWSSVAAHLATGRRPGAGRAGALAGRSLRRPDRGRSGARHRLPGAARRRADGPAGGDARRRARPGAAAGPAAFAPGPRRKPAGALPAQPTLFADGAR